MKALVSFMSRHVPRHLSRHAAVIAAGLCAVAAIAFAVPLDGYSHADFPIALIGAKGMPRALLFDLVALVIPGLLLAWLCLRVRAALPATAPWTARLGVQILQLSALAFAAQGVLPLDLADLEGPASARHAAVWMLWWLTFATGAMLFAVGVHRLPALRALAAPSATLAVLVPMFALFVSYVIPSGFAQRIAFALWFAWMLAAEWRINRNGFSAPGSSTTRPV